MFDYLKNVYIGSKVLSIVLRMAQSKLINLDFVKENSFNNTAFLKEVLEIFLQSTPGLLDELREACGANDWDRLKKVAHKLKPQAQTFGIGALEPILEYLENVNPDAKNINEVIEFVERAVGLVNEALNEVNIELHSLES
ncbi:MAG: Hpt domain-containing protein [Chitinophagales bacterium]|nr:Hpt domain-containing protein [Chitinophagales bacterium]